MQCIFPFPGLATRIAKNGVDRFIVDFTLDSEKNPPNSYNIGGWNLDLGFSDEKKGTYEPSYQISVKGPNPVFSTTICTLNWLRPSLEVVMGIKEFLSFVLDQSNF